MNMQNPVEPLILDAWQTIKPRLLKDRDELNRRLARRNRPTLLRPPRAWCLAVRASDRRINSHDAITIPDDAADYARPRLFRPHTVTLTTDLLRWICRPIQLLPPGELVTDVARMLGVTPTGLTRARLRGRFQTHYVAGLGGRRGRPVPLVYSRQVLDPSARLFATPDLLWQVTAGHLIYRIPEDLRQDIERIPHYQPASSIQRQLNATHPEAGEPPPRRPSRRLPPPPPDDVWYKWEGDTYVGDRLIEAQLRKLRRKSPYRPRPSRSAGSLRFNGWYWVCPGCRRHVRMLYYPLPPLRLPYRLPPAITAQLDNHPLKYDNLYAPCFACGHCHCVRDTGGTLLTTWNHLITHLTRGLLYGAEVKRPDWFSPQRRRAYRPQSHRPAPRRQQVLRRLLNGWSSQRIARDLHIGFCAVHNHIRALCKQENVPDRHALARKLNAAVPPPLNQDERAAERRKQVLELLLAGRSYKQIMSELSLDFSTVNRDTDHLYKEHQVHGRRELARKLGADPKTDRDRRIEATRARIAELRAAGQTWPQIAKELKIPFYQVQHHAKVMSRQRRRACVAPHPGAALSTLPAGG